MSRRVIVIALCWLVGAAAGLSSTSVAHAQPELQDKYTPEEWKRGTKLFKQGLRLFKAGKYKKACAKLEESYRVVAGIGVRGKLGECYEKLEQHANAWLAYRDVVEMGVRYADVKRVEVARERVAALEELITLVTVESASTPIEDLRITVDGEPVELMERTFPLDPGTRAIIVEREAEGDEPAGVLKRTIKARAGQRDTLQVPDLVELLRVQNEPPGKKRRPGLLTMGIISVAVGVGALGAGGFYGYQAREKWLAVETNCPSGRCVDNDTLEQVEAAGGDALKANILVGSGLVLGTVGALLWRAGSGDKPSASREKRGEDGVDVGWRVAPGGGMSVVVSGHF